MILAGDVGGTKTLLALFKPEGEGWVCSQKKRYASIAYPSFIELLGEFLEGTDRSEICACCLGVAGPVIDGDCKTTNLPWMLKNAEIAAELGTQVVFLINDLEATAWGVLESPAQCFVQLNPNAQTQPGHKAVIAAGTGLGEAIIVWNGKKHQVLPTEGGHCNFAPTTELEIALLQFMLGQPPQHVSYEQLVSGPGLVKIYEFLKEINYAPAQAEIEALMLQTDPAEVIGMAGVAGSDTLCVQALSLFCKLYGQETGNLALKSLPYAGIYLAGGIVAKILPFMQGSEFMEAFLAKGLISTVLRDIPVKVCTNQDVALSGAVSCALRKMKA